MNVTTQSPAFKFSLFKTRPWFALGVGTVLFLRFLYGVFFLIGTLNKYKRNYLFSDYPLELFTSRLEQIDPNGIMAAYLQSFLIPHYRFVGVCVVLIWTAATVGLLLGLATRWAAALALFACVNIGLGGFYDASLIPLGIIPLIIMLLPTGHWCGMDRRLHAKYPQAIAFR